MTDLLALGSSGRSFEEGSHLCFIYLKKKIYIYIYTYIKKNRAVS